MQKEQKTGRAEAAKIPSWQQRLATMLAVLAWVMALLMFFNVVARYVFNRVWIPLQELVVYFHASLFMLGAVLAWRLDRHVRVDVFQQAFGARAKGVLERLGNGLLMLPFMVFMVWVSFDYVRQSWLRLEGSAETGGLPGVFLLKSLLLVVPLAFIVLLLADVWRALRQKNRQEL